MQEENKNMRLCGTDPIECTAGSLANLLRHARRKQEYAIMRD
jgi:hypothetical protein